MIKQMRRKNGFTLIELLVAISIIAILTALLTANYVGARQRGRDTQRKANLYNIQQSLELYRADNGTYPLTSELSTCGGAFTSSGGTTYMQKIPCDPTTDIPYVYTSDGVTYDITACIENEEDSDKDAAPVSPCTTSFTLTNP